ncbi:hypothetical protein HFRIS_004933 [Herbaspirillum frisingense GSF30]|uniref:Uncharacterized protein n=1 Tax=Herbaspirillum frisingense GSF30 TaxID=864073 RepID=A0AAI9IGQ6_9BURK|nr:hypothetical protein [Herbaspirillum frisingense]EOA05775.1 hypothetical protein HFRIS_004933 [Herbaspirillum frisingense GSF30]
MMNFPLSLTVTGMQPVSQVGNYVYYKAGSAGGADPSIKVNTDLGDEYILMPGQGFRLDNAKFSNLRVTNAGGQATILGVLLIADGGFFDNRVTGSVEIIDGGKNRTLAGGAFLASGYKSGSAGNGVVNMLWNPIGTGKRLVISAFAVNSATSTAMNVIAATASYGAKQANGNSKMLGGAQSVGEFWAGNGTAPAGTVMLSISAIAAQVFEKKFAEPLVLRPGNGLAIFSGGSGADLGGYFEYFEETDA